MTGTLPTTGSPDLRRPVRRGQPDQDQHHQGLFRIASFANFFSRVP
ncbi:hypothetical protein [Amycolatopsis sp. NPDC051071]